MFVLLFFFCKQKTAYEMRISDWSSDVCSADLEAERLEAERVEAERLEAARAAVEKIPAVDVDADAEEPAVAAIVAGARATTRDPDAAFDLGDLDPELVDIFVEEAGDLLDHSDGLLAQLRESPTR